MSRSFVDALLGGAIVVAVALTWALERDTRQPGLEFLPEMAHSAAYQAYTANPNFEDGKTLQLPVSGTIARGHNPVHFEATPEEAIRAGREFHNPLPDEASSIQRGRDTYRIFCTPCHGAGGLGDGPVVRRGVPAPPSLLAEKAVSLADGQIFHILTFGQGNMPDYASQLSQEERWRTIQYVRSLQQSSSDR